MDLLLTNLRLATLDRDDGYGLIEDAALGIDDGTIRWIGPAADARGGASHTVDCHGRLVTPGLIDCHTHLVYGGDRAQEFEMRLEGATYEEIARAGGGIVSTVAATRAAREEDLVAAARPRLDSLRAEGVTTVEIKSGYGLDVETECRMLRAARRLGGEHPVDVVTSFLGAHALPPEYRDDRAAYVDLACRKALPAVADEGLADAVDGFCEGIAFTPQEIDEVFAAARALGLPVKLHAEQLSDLGGAKVAAKHGALSVDHVEYLADEGVRAVAAAGTVAVLLPGAFYYLNETRTPPVAALRSAGVPIAVATDLNPGSSPVHSLLAAMNMACVLFKLTPLEAVRGVTVNAARALGLTDRGRIARDLKADLAVWDVDRPGALAYPLGFNPCRMIIKDGLIIEGDR